MEGVLFFLLKEAHFVSPRYRLHLVAHPVGVKGKGKTECIVFLSVNAEMRWPII
jgi:hypothetical protein